MWPGVLEYYGIDLATLTYVIKKYFSCVYIIDIISYTIQQYL